MNFSRKWIKKGIVGSFGLVFLTSCGLDLDNILNPKESNAVDKEEFEFIDLGLNVDTSQVNLENEQFGLSAISCTTIRLKGENSAAGYNIPEADFTSGSVRIVKGDKIQLKITSVTCGGVIYNLTNAGAVNFTTWVTGDEGTLAAGNGAKMTFTYGSNCYDNDGCNNLGEPLQLTAIGFTLGTAQTADAATYENAINLSFNGSVAPPFTFHGFAHRGFDVATGRIKFSQAWACSSPIADLDGAGPGTAFGCGGTNFDMFKVIWVNDPASGGTPTAAQMRTAIVAVHPFHNTENKQGSLQVNQSKKVPAGATSPHGIGTAIANGGVSVDEVLTGNNAYGATIKYACIFEGPDQGQGPEGMTCVKVTFTGISQ
jgi:hypothetical protein